MMRDILLDVRLPFATSGEREGSEDVLLWFLGVVSRLNLYYLRQHPETPLLYESGVRYALPEQMDECRVAEDKIEDLGYYLRYIGASEETAGIVQRFVSGVEIFRDIPALYKRKRGDCDNVVAARVAELWAAGLMAGPYLTKSPNDRGGTTYHAIVRHHDGSTEDPSLILGMGGVSRAADRAEEIRKNYERRDNMLQAAVRLVRGGESPEIVGGIIDACGFVPRRGFA